MKLPWYRAARWWVADYSYVVHRQVRGMFTMTRPSTLTTGELAPIVILPGIYEPWKFLTPLISELRERGHPVHVVEQLKLNLRPVSESAALVGEFLETNGLDGVIIVAHSKGGLIGKQVMVSPPGALRVKAMVAVATPFGGSVYAKFMLAPSLRIFSPRDATIRALAAEESVNSRIVSIYGTFDPHIPAGSELPGAKNIELDTGGHFRVLANARILEEVALLDR
jgi:pimeloyl-ACP methyl ester carboxylesterase